VTGLAAKAGGGPFLGGHDKSSNEFGYCSRRLPWCLWCLFGAEIDAIHAEQLKELKQARL